MSKHTPGPWTIEDGYIISEKWDNICLIIPRFSKVKPTEEVLANARLIVAAPELLKVCKRFVKSSACKNGCSPKDMTCDTQFAKRIIAKVKNG